MSAQLFSYHNLLFGNSDSSKSQHLDGQRPPFYWSTKYFDTLSMPESTVANKLVKYARLNSIHKDFVCAATTYAKTIISEFFIPDEFKTLHPKQVGGQSGIKYLLHDIFFKLASGNCGPFEGEDESAAKAMGHEMKGANSYYRSAIPGLHVALQVLIDYKGFRMHCQATLCIGEETLRVGSSDAARTLHCCDRPLLEKTRLAARELNLSGHLVRETEIFTACDLEGHYGTDGRYYVVDLARAFPPECPAGVMHLAQCGEFRCGQRVFFCKSSGDASSRAGGDWVLGVVEAVDYPSSTTPSPTEVLYSVRLPDGVVCKNVLESSLRNGCQSIFWRLLRPEFVKDRGRDISRAHRTAVDPVLCWRLLRSCLRSASDTRNNLQSNNQVNNTAAQPGNFSLTQPQGSSNRGTPQPITPQPLRTPPTLTLPPPTHLWKPSTLARDLHARGSNALNASVPETVAPEGCYSSDSSELLTTLADLQFTSVSTLPIKNTVPAAPLTAVGAADFDAPDPADLIDASKRQKQTQEQEEYASDVSALFDGYRYSEFAYESDTRDLGLWMGGEDASGSTEHLPATNLLQPDPVSRASSFLRPDAPRARSRAPSFSLGRAEDALEVSAVINSITDTLVFSESLSFVTPRPVRHLSPLERQLEAVGQQVASGGLAEPLSADALSRFAQDSPDADGHNRRVREATLELVHCLIPAMARDLFEKPHPQKRFHLSLCEYLHVYGINMRHLGLLRFWLGREVVRRGRSQERYQCTHPRPSETLFGGSGHGHSDANRSKAAADDSHAYSFPKLKSSDDLLNTSETLESLGLMRHFSEPVSEASNYLRQQSGRTTSSSSHGPLTLEKTVSADKEDLYRAWYDMQSELLQECLCRAVKSLVRVMQREWIKLQRVASEQGLIDILVRILNLVTGAHPNSKVFWGITVTRRVCEKFGRISLAKFPDVFADGVEPMDGGCIARSILCPWSSASSTGAEEECCEFLSLADLVEYDPAFVHSLVHKLCHVTGVRLTDECLLHFKHFTRELGRPSLASLTSPHRTTRASFPTHSRFEFVVSDVRELLPRVKHMHQQDLIEGLTLSLTAEKRQEGDASREDLSVALRLVDMATQRLHTALTAVPDDHHTRHGLADAYQIEGYICQKLERLEKHELCSRVELRSREEFPTLCNSLDSQSLRAGSPPQTLRMETELRDRIAAIVNKRELAVRNYKRLKHDLQHTFCCALGLSHREDVIGMVVEISHFLPLPERRGSSGGHGRHSPRPVVLTGGDDKSEPWPWVRIDDVSMPLPCFSLSHYLAQLRAGFTSFAGGPRAEETPRAEGGGKAKHRTKQLRFFPLIIDDDHGERALPLLCAEIVRADRLTRDDYDFSLDADHQTPVTSPSELHIKSTLPLPQSPPLPPLTPEAGLRVLSALTNSAVVSFLKGSLSLTDQALVGYIRLHHMLLFLSRGSEGEQWRLCANQRVDLFLQQPERRRKIIEPNLGCFLIYLLVADRSWTRPLAEAFFLESLNRQVSWFLKKRNSKHLLNAAANATDITTAMAVESTPLNGSFPLASRTSTPGLLRRGSSQQLDLDRSTLEDHGSVTEDGSVQGTADDTVSVASQTPQRQSSTRTHVDGNRREQEEDKFTEELAWLEPDPVSVFRLLKTFEVTRLSLRLVMFQVYFVQLCRGESEFSSRTLAASTPQRMIHSNSRDGNSMLQLYNASLGCPTPAMKEGLKEAYTAITEVSDYEGFLRRIGLEYSPHQMTLMLRNAVRCSVKYEYLKSPNYRFIANSPLERVPPSLSDSSRPTYASALAPTSLLAQASGGKEMTWAEARTAFACMSTQESAVVRQAALAQLRRINDIYDDKEREKKAKADRAYLANMRSSSSRDHHNRSGRVDRSPQRGQSAPANQHYTRQSSQRPELSRSNSGGHTYIQNSRNNHSSNTSRHIGSSSSVPSGSTASETSPRQSLTHSYSNGSSAGGNKSQTLFRNKFTVLVGPAGGRGFDRSLSNHSEASNNSDSSQVALPSSTLTTSSAVTPLTVAEEVATIPTIFPVTSISVPDTAEGANVNDWQQPGRKNKNRERVKPIYQSNIHQTKYNHN